VNHIGNAESVAEVVDEDLDARLLSRSRVLRGDARSAGAVHDHCARDEHSQRGKNAEVHIVDRTAYR